MANVANINDFVSTIAPQLLFLVSLWGLRLFLSVITAVSIRHANHLFLSAHGRSHRTLGGAQLVWILLGAYLCGQRNVRPLMIVFYDLILALLGTTATLSAARDFPHKYVKNARGQSGSLGERASITQAEMIEHAFYQILNLFQILYLHGMATVGPEPATNSLFYRFLALLAVSSPWFLRRNIPVHSFSDNWKKTPKHERTETEVFLYRVKKSQYLFYKHVCLHGLNIAMALRPSTLSWTTDWRLFWLHLNASYVMEFFLQSLVKRKVLKQRDMLWLQRLLITSASLSAVVPILSNMNVPICLISLILNFFNRYHDVENTVGVALIVGFILHFHDGSFQKFKV